MNIHFTSTRPVECAEFLDDVRVNKMLTENVQMLSTAVIYTLDAELALHSRKKENKERTTKLCKELGTMKPTHPNHPCAVWVRKSRENAFWLVRYTEALFEEFRVRFSNDKHASMNVLRHIVGRGYLETLPSRGSTKPPNCAAHKGLGIDYRENPNIFRAYQLYLNDRWDHDRKEPKWTRG